MEDRVAAAMEEDGAVVESGSSGDATPRPSERGTPAQLSNPGTPPPAAASPASMLPPSSAAGSLLATQAALNSAAAAAGGRSATGQPASKYTQLLAVIEDMGKDIRPTYAGSKMSSERLKRGIVHARILVRECLMECERAARS